MRKATHTPQLVLKKSEWKSMMKILDISLLEVRRIERNIAIEYTKKFHYLHRASPCSRAFGLFLGEEIKGVIIYGVPPSSTLLRGICGDEESKNVYELNRLWVADDMPKNTESFFIAQTFKDLDREIIVSYADSAQEHIGYVYQATNWIYTGTSAKFKDPMVKGLEHQHHATYAHGMNKKQLLEKYGDRLYYKERPLKHRYIIFIGNKRRKRELRKKLKYKALPYPKLPASSSKV